MPDDATTLPHWSDLLADPEEERLAQLTTKLAALDGPADEDGGWPTGLWSALTEHGVPLWSIPHEFGGEACERLSLLQVHAHPDDEASKGAGTTAKYAAEGVHNVLVCCTGGEAGDILNPAVEHPGSPEAMYEFFFLNS